MVHLHALLLALAILSKLDCFRLIEKFTLQQLLSLALDAVALENFSKTCRVQISVYFSAQYRKDRIAFEIYRNMFT